MLNDQPLQTEYFKLTTKAKRPMSLFITSLLISLIATLWVWMMGRRDPAGRPWLTGLCLGMLMILPLLAMLPKLTLDVVTVGAGGSDLQTAGLWHWLLWGWGAGSALMILRWVRGQWILKQWLRDSVPVVGDDWNVCVAECGSMLGLKSNPDVRLKRGLSSPVVAGLWHPVILMPEGAEHWKLETRKMAMLHELAHVQRKDLWLRMAADLTCALHWYNPLVRWMRAKLLSQCEYACDAWVIDAGANQRSYILALCDVLESALGEPRPVGLLAMSDHAPLKTRVDRLLKNKKANRPWWAFLAAALTISTALGLTLVRPVQNVESESSSGSSMIQEVKLRHSANPFPGN